MLNERLEDFRPNTAFAGDDAHRIPLYRPFQREADWEGVSFNCYFTELLDSAEESR